ncbi:jacalin-related lectin 3 isoform X1 [Daucus carota subsp. sativus]|uniref:jacalin-related lectin 3 isoform X1 n=1 Tax=Daucus carota subsp. sativus TaxID=79200 RepID=UPI0007B29F2C|nr:PREDICTED: jacalin-related lectin 3 [Daucus carota subsp. sativus]
MENYMGKSTVKLGPWGGQDGIHWDDGVYSTVRQVEIAHGTGIDSIRVEYDSSGVSIWSEKHGGQGGNITDKVKLEYPEEFLTSMHGHYGSLKGWGPALIKSLTLISNKRSYGPYGTEEGTYFSLPMTGGKIVGFHGKGGWYLDAIGVHFEPTYKQNPQNSVAQFSQNAYSTNDNFGYSMIQGSLNKQYDVVIAVKQKDSNANFLPNYFSKKNQFTITDYPTPKPATDSRNQFTITDYPTPKPATDSRKNQFTVTDNPYPKQTKVVVPPTVPRVPSKDVKDVYTYGPWGGAGGTVFDDSTYDGIRQIRVKRNVAIVSIKVCYDFKGEAVWGSKNGGSGSFKKDLIVFDYPSEVLTHITGYYGPTMVMGPNVIKSLTFHTTKSYYGPYGEEQGQPFSSNLKEGRIVGFHGRKGLFLDAIGVHVIEGKVLPKLHSPSKALPADIASSGKPVPPVSSSNQVLHPKNPPTTLSIKPAIKVTLPTDSPAKVLPPAISPKKPTKQQNELAIKQPGSPKWSFITGRRGASEEDHTYQGVQRVIKDPAPHGTGPWGGEGGKPWDDGVFTGIRQIILTMSPHAICAIEIEYDRNGQSVWSVAHGANRGGQTSERVKLEFPHEVLTCISGYYGAISKDEAMKVIKSLTLYTSRKKYGPFGEEKGTFFTSAKTEGKVVGLHGRSSMYLDAIGVHMQHWLGNQKPKQSSTIMKLFS